MKIINVIQGSPEWSSHRSKYLNASDAAAAMGLSRFKTRSELMREIATGITPDHDAATLARFARGHEFEAIARPWAEEIIGEDLFPVVMSDEIDGLSLSASFDGIDMAEAVTFECKTANASLIASLEAGEIPAEYKPQMEQGLMIAGAKRCLFMAAAGDRDSMRYAWYESDQNVRAGLIAAWKQLIADLISYTPPEIIQAAIAAPQMQLPAVSVQVTGGVAVADNLALFGDALRAYIERINRQPATDQDFADLEATVKTLKTAEEALESAKSNALGQVASIDLMKRTADQLQELARANRLTVEKLVRAEKENRRNAIIRAGHDAIEAFVAAANGRIGRDYMPRSVPYFAEAVKGLKTISSIQNAVDTELARCKITASEAEARITTNLATLRSLAADVPFLLHDTATIIQKAPDDLTALVKARIAEHKAAQAMNMEIEREKIRQEITDSKAPASVPDNQANVQQNAAIVPLQHSMDNGRTLKLEEIGTMLGFLVTAAFMNEIGFNPVRTEKAAKLYRSCDFPLICSAIARHVTEIGVNYSDTKIAA